MNIDQYNFGKIIVDGQEFAKDVIITPNKVLPNWWRQQGHKLHLQDLESIWEYNPEVVIIGTGKMGIMKVPNAVEEQIKEHNVQLFVERTPQACNRYNDMKRSHRVVAALHLTC